MSISDAIFLPLSPSTLAASGRSVLEGELIPSFWIRESLRPQPRVFTRHPVDRLKRSGHPHEHTGGQMASRGPWASRCSSASGAYPQFLRGAYPQFLRGAYPPAPHAVHPHGLRDPSWTILMPPPVSACDGARQNCPPVDSLQVLFLSLSELSDCSFPLWALRDPYLSEFVMV